MVDVFLPNIRASNRMRIWQTSKKPVQFLSSSKSNSPKKQNSTDFQEPNPPGTPLIQPEVPVSVGTPFQPQNASCFITSTPTVPSTREKGLHRSSFYLSPNESIIKDVNISKNASRPRKNVSFTFKSPDSFIRSNRKELLPEGTEKSTSNVRSFREHSARKYSRDRSNTSLTKDDSDSNKIKSKHSVKSINLSSADLSSKKLAFDNPAGSLVKNRYHKKSSKVSSEDSSSSQDEQKQDFINNRSKRKQEKSNHENISKDTISNHSKGNDEKEKYINSKSRLSHRDIKSFHEDAVEQHEQELSLVKEVAKQANSVDEMQKEATSSTSDKSEDISEDDMQEGEVCPSVKNVSLNVKSSPDFKVEIKSIRNGEDAFSSSFQGSDDDGAKKSASRINSLSSTFGRTRDKFLSDLKENSTNNSPITRDNTNLNKDFIHENSSEENDLTPSSENNFHEQSKSVRTGSHTDASLTQGTTKHVVKALRKADGKSSLREVNRSTDAQERKFNDTGNTSFAKNELKDSRFSGDKPERSKPEFKFVRDAFKYSSDDEEGIGNKVSSQRDDKNSESSQKEQNLTPKTKSNTHKNATPRSGSKTYSGSRSASGKNLISDYFRKEVPVNRTEHAVEKVSKVTHPFVKFNRSVSAKARLNYSDSEYASDISSDVCSPVVKRKLEAFQNYEPKEGDLSLDNQVLPAPLKRQRFEYDKQVTVTKHHSLYAETENDMTDEETLMLLQEEVTKKRAPFRAKKNSTSDEKEGVESDRKNHTRVDEVIAMYRGRNRSRKISDLTDLDLCLNILRDVVKKYKEECSSRNIQHLLSHFEFTIEDEILILLDEVEKYEELKKKAEKERRKMNKYCRELTYLRLKEKRVSKKKKKVEDK